MARPLATAWPTLVDSSGTPGSGTKLAKEHFDQILDAIDTSIYAEDLSEGPPEVAREVVEARASYDSLDARLDAIALSAAGGAAEVGSGGAQKNLVPNDTFLIWSAGDSAAPDGWTAEATAFAVTRENTIAGATKQGYLGRNVVKLVNSAGASAKKDFYIDIVSAAEISSLNDPQFLKSRKVAGGVAVWAPSNLVEIHIDDGVTSIGAATLVGGNYDANNSWVWSADGAANKGGVTLPTAPTRLRFIVRVLGNGTAYVSCPAFFFAETAPYYVPSGSRMGTMLFGVDNSGEVSTGIKAEFNPPCPIQIVSARVRCSTAAATAVTAEIYKDGSAVMGGLLTTGASADSGLKGPASRALASFSATNLMKVSILAADSTARGAYIQIRYLEFPRALDAAFYGA